MITSGRGDLFDLAPLGFESRQLIAGQRQVALGVVMIARLRVERGAALGQLAFGRGDQRADLAALVQTHPQLPLDDAQLVGDLPHVPFQRLGFGGGVGQLGVGLGRNEAVGKILRPLADDHHQNDQDADEVRDDVEKGVDACCVAFLFGLRHGGKPLLTGGCSTRRSGFIASFSSRAPSCGRHAAGAS